MAVVGDEVMVCVIYNKDTIMEYDRELKCVRQIVGRGMGISVTYLLIIMATCTSLITLILASKSSVTTVTTLLDQ